MNRPRRRPPREVPDGATPEWRRVERRLRVLSRAHLAMIAVTAFVLIAAAAILGAGWTSADTARTERADLLREVLVVRADLRAAEETAWRARARGTRPLFAMNAEPEEIRTTITDLAARSVLLEPRSAPLARDAVAAASGAIDRLARPVVRAGDLRPSRRADVALTQWAEALERAEERAAQASLTGITRTMTTALVALTMLAAGVGVLGAIAVDRARRRMVAEFDAALTEQRSLYRTAATVAGETDVDRVLERIATEAADLLGAEHAAVIRFVGGEMGEVAGAYREGHVWDGPVPLTGDGVVARAGRTDAPAVEDDYAGSEDETCRRLAAAGMRSGVAVPVHMDGRPWGALVCLSRTPRAFAPASADQLHRYAGLAGVALSNAAHRERLEAQASTDPLTGLPNHRAFRDRLEAEASRARRHDTDLALVIVDVDRFGQVNATLGHKGGDRVLAELASVMRAAARGSDLVARIGGQQFAVLMPEASSWGAWSATERLRATVARASVGGVEGQTISAGVCDLRQAGGDAERMMEFASGALYWAKRHGRDLCVRYSPEVVIDLSAAERAARLERTRALDAVRLLAQAVDARDPNTQRHSERVAAIAREVAREMGWAEDRVHLLYEAALVHDVGKIGVPDSILLKDGPLTPDERERVQAHAALGAQMVTDVLCEDQVGWVRSHHERWDGAGYPDALAGPLIPDGSRILAVADSYDAMTSDRPYRTGLAPDVALQEILRARGAQFAPEAVDAFMRIAVTGRLAAAHRSAAA